MAVYIRLGWRRAQREGEPIIPMGPEVARAWKVESRNSGQCSVMKTQSNTIQGIYVLCIALYYRTMYVYQGLNIALLCTYTKARILRKRKYVTKLTS